MQTEKPVEMRSLVAAYLVPSAKSRALSMENAATTDMRDLTAWDWYGNVETLVAASRPAIGWLKTFIIGWRPISVNGTQAKTIVRALTQNDNETSIDQNEHYRLFVFYLY